MKTLLLACLLTVSTFSIADILDIIPPTVMCPGETEVFKVTYVFTYSPFGLPRENVLSVTWDFLKGSAIVKTVNSSGYTVTTPIGSKGQANATVSGLPSGPLTVRVTIKTLYMTQTGSQVKTYTRSEGIAVGILTPTSITGPGNICEGDARVYQSNTIAGAASYTWEVPADWTVDGIAGPIVTGRGAQVSIIANGDLHSSNSISVRAVSTTCGATLALKKTVVIDHPAPVITMRDLGDLKTRFTASQNSYSNLFWTVPATWTVDNDAGNYIDIFSNGQADTVFVSATTSCNTFVETGFFFVPGETTEGGCISVYPTLVTSYITIEPCQYGVASVIIDGTIDLSASLEADGSNYRLDLTELPEGIHVMEIRQQNGRLTTFRFVKE